MQQDAAHLSDLSTDLGVGLLQSLILLVSFVGVLWELSSGFVFHINGWSLAIPGYMFTKPACLLLPSISTDAQRDR